MHATPPDAERLRAATDQALHTLAQASADGRDCLTHEALATLLQSFGLDRDLQAQPEQDWQPLLRLQLENTREFGLVLCAQTGGAAASLAQARAPQARTLVAAALAKAAEFVPLLHTNWAYQSFAAAAQQRGLPPPDHALQRLVEQLLALATALESSPNPGARTLQCLDLDVAPGPQGLQVRFAQCLLAPPLPTRHARPVHKIHQLLHPGRIGVIGVSSTSMNFGRIILRNLMGSGYPKEQLCIIREGETEIDGVPCVAGLQALEQPLDLLIVAVAAQAVYGLVDEILASRCVHAVMLIPGSLGETLASREPAAALAARIQAAHAEGDGGPIFLGANCLGVVSHAGGYDSWFIPLERLPKPQKKPVRRAAMMSQSGAFMITRLSQNPWLDPRYMLALGNQTDLTHGDMMQYFATHADVDTIGVYIEGFKDHDGLAFARAVRTATLNGKQVVVYKAGRTPAGSGAALGHTASLAGDPELFDAVVGHAGAIVATDFSSFDDLFYVAGELHGKQVAGTRLGAISGAGFEAVGIADSTVAATYALHMGTLEDATTTRIQDLLRARKLDALVEVRNPIDINPGADDEVHMQIVQAFLDDPGIDAVVVGLDPTAPTVRALESSQLRPGYDLQDPKSTVQLMPLLVRANAKPVIGIVDGGALYDAMAARLMDQGVCVFRNCARGTRALARYIGARCYAQALRNAAPKP